MPDSSGALVWDRDGRDWPNRTASHFVSAADLRWHVQQMGQGPSLLLLHGTGASTHSWRALAPLLADRYSVAAPDLPGHGFTSASPPDELSLPGMAAAVGTLLETMEFRPQLAVGHSAGAAILVRMCLDGLIAPHTLISLNGALLPMRGAPGHFFSPIAKLLSSSSLVPRLFAWRARDREVVARLLHGTGSRVDEDGLELYRRLMRSPEHAGAALQMMANWDLEPLQRDLPSLKPRLILVVGTNDRSIPPSSAYRVHALVPGSTLSRLRGLGHLAHEEQPERLAEVIAEAAEPANESGPS